MKRIAAILLAGVFLALPGWSQGNCSTLSVTTTVDPVLPVQTVTFGLSGSPANDPVLLAMGPTLGATTINLRPLGTVVLGLQRPFSTMSIGLADANGALTRSFKVPSDLALTLNAQAVGMDVTLNRGKPTASFCTSNVVTFGL